MLFRSHRETDHSYRTTHRVVGDMVLRALNQGLDATEVGADIVNESARETIGDEFDIDDEFVQDALDPRAFVETHDVPGGPAPREVRRMISDRRANLDEHRAQLNQRREGLETAAQELDEFADKLTS